MSDLISREELRKAFHERIWHFDKSSWDEANALIDNAPTVDLISPTINVNISEETKQKLIEELQKPHKLLVLPEPEVAFERPQGDCEKCNFRNFSETFIDGVVDVMNKNGITSVEQLQEILKGGAE